jgi:hypothetical protein|tara:strand:- start:1463 stop:1708 length:246 start_codon:yes stop_codon:yes gene_type:complete
MKVYEITEGGYGLRQGGPAMSKGTTDMANANTRQNNTYTDQGREAEIKQTHAMRAEKRKFKAPTGIPARMLSPQLPAGPGQ